MFPPRDWTLTNLTSHCKAVWGITPRPTWLRTYTGGAQYTAQLGSSDHAPIDSRSMLQVTISTMQVALSSPTAY